MDDNSTAGQILDGALVALSRAGTRRLSITEVAERAGVARGTVYRYFPDRKTLMAAVDDHVRETFERGLAEATDGHQDIDVRIEKSAAYVAEFPSSLFGVLQRDDVDSSWLLERLRSQRTELLEAIRGTLASSIPSPAAEPDVVDIISRLILRVGLAEYLVPGPDDEDIVADIRLIWHSLSTSTGTRTS